MKKLSHKKAQAIAEEILRRDLEVNGDKLICCQGYVLLSRRMGLKPTEPGQRRLVNSWYRNCKRRVPYRDYFCWQHKKRPQGAKHGEA